MLQNIGLLVVLNLIVKPSWLLVDFVVQDRISHEKYGVYAALLSLSYLFINVSDMGINLYVTKRFASDKNSLRNIFANTFSFKIIICLIYPFFMVSIGWILGYDQSNLHYLFILSFIQALLQTVYFFRSSFQAYEYFKIDAFISVVDKFLLLLFVLVLLAYNITLSSFVYAILASAILTFLISYYFVLKVHGWIKPSMQFFPILHILKLSFPFALMGILFAINERIDMVMIERLGGEQGAKNAGLYAAAYRWVDAILMYLWTIVPIFFAKFSIHSNEPQEQQKLLNIGQVMFFVPMLFVSVFVFIYGEKLFWLFEGSTKDELLSMTSILKILFLSVIVQGLCVIYFTYLNSTGHEKGISGIIIISIMLNVVCDFLFIPQYGPVAAAYVSLTCTLVVSILSLIYFYKRTNVKIPAYIILKLVVVSAIFSLIFYALSLTSMEWYVNSILAGFLLVLMVYLSNVGGIRQIIKSDI